MAQLNHISEQTLRLYDKEGLLKAQEVDLKSGYRYYHILQSARLDLIQNLKMYGLTLKQIKDILNPLSFFYNIGTVIRKERLEKGTIFSDEVFFFVDGNGFLGQCETVPAATYVCICSDDFTEEEENAKRLLQYIKDMGYQIAGDYLCEAVIDFPVLEDTKRHIFSKIQIPVFFT